MEAINELATALAKAQGMIEPAPRDADNPFFHSKYASLPAIREAMREAFAANGLSVVQIPEVVTVADGVGRIQLRTLLLHSSGQSLDCGALSGDVDLSNPQKIGSWISYFRRYSLAAISQTVSDSDTDAQDITPQTKLTPKEQSYMADALKDFALAKSSEDLEAIGLVIKEKATPAVKNALRKAYEKRQLELKEKENASCDSLVSG